MMVGFILAYHVPAVLLALLLDLLLGDPQWRFHPVRCMGLLASGFEAKLRNSVRSERIAGLLTWLLTLAVCTAVGVLLVSAARFFPDPLRIVLYGVIIYFCLALKDLYKHGWAVKRALEKQNITAAREKLALMVSRDTGALDAEGVIRCVIESLSENFSDSVIAPVLYALFCGPIGAVVYRVVNTMDAMFGYKNEKYYHFGFVAARMDDICNFLPSRVSGLLLALFAPLTGGSLSQAFRVLIRDSRKHTSPNSGFPEAAVAGALGIRLGGEASYFGRITVKPTIGDDANPLTLTHIARTCLLMGIPVGVIMVVCCIVTLKGYLM